MEVWNITYEMVEAEEEKEEEQAVNTWDADRLSVTWKTEKRGVTAVPAHRMDLHV